MSLVFPPFYFIFDCWLKCYFYHYIRKLFLLYEKIMDTTHMSHKHNATIVNYTLLQVIDIICLFANIYSCRKKKLFYHQNLYLHKFDFLVILCKLLLLLLFSYGCKKHLKVIFYFLVKVYYRLSQY